MRILLSLLSIIIAATCYSQVDTAFIAQMQFIDTANTLRLDTAAVPQDALSGKIRELRSIRRGLNVQTLLLIKVKEEQGKDTTKPAAFYDALLKEISTGKTSMLIENSLVNLYRQNFTTKEIDDLIIFYKTPAGQKMDTVFYLLVAQSMKDAEQLLKLAATRIDTAGK